MGQKSRAKRTARQRRGSAGDHARTARRRQTGFNRSERWLLLGVLAVLIVGVGFLAKSAFTSTPTAAPSSTLTSNMSSINNSSDGQGIAVGRRVAMTDMAMPATSGANVALNKYRGKKLVVYFYEGVT